MAARRIRIKGIANIPQRRKGVSGNQSDSLEPNKLLEETDSNNEKNSIPNQASDNASKSEILQVATGSTIKHLESLEPNKLVEDGKYNNVKNTGLHHISDDANKSENVRVTTGSDGNKSDAFEPSKLVEETDANIVKKPIPNQVSDDANKCENWQMPTGSSDNHSDDLELKEIVEQANVNIDENAIVNDTSGNAIQSKNLHVPAETQNGDSIQTERLESADTNSAASNSCKVQEANGEKAEKPDNSLENTLANTQEKSSIKQPFRRRFLKPVITKVILNRTAKHKVENSDTVNKDDNTNKENIDLPKEAPKSVHFELNNVQNNDEAQENKAVQLFANDSAISGSDTENVPAPPSPSKINRLRIKAVPRLGQRRTSFSASESEDDNKKNYNRHRNDSVRISINYYQVISRVTYLLLVI